MTAGFAVFFSVINLVQSGQFELAALINSSSSNTFIFGVMSYLAAALIKAKNSNAWIPLVVGTIYPVSHSLTTGAPLNFIIVLVGLYFLYRLYQINNDRERG